MVRLMLVSSISTYSCPSTGTGGGGTTGAAGGGAAGAGTDTAGRGTGKEENSS